MLTYVTNEEVNKIKLLLLRLRINKLSLSGDTLISVYKVLFAVFLPANTIYPRRSSEIRRTSFQGWRCRRGLLSVSESQEDGGPRLSYYIICNMCLQRCTDGSVTTASQTFWPKYSRMLLVKLNSNFPTYGMVCNIYIPYHNYQIFPKLLILFVVLTWLDKVRLLSIKLVYVL